MLRQPEVVVARERDERAAVLLRGRGVRPRRRREAAAQPAAFERGELDLRHLVERRACAVALGVRVCAAHGNSCLSMPGIVAEWLNRSTLLAGVRPPELAGSRVER